MAGGEVRQRPRADVRGHEHRRSILFFQELDLRCGNEFEAPIALLPDPWQLRDLGERDAGVTEDIAHQLLSLGVSELRKCNL